MAKNKVYIDVVIDDKGTTKRVAVNAKKLGSALEDTGKSARTADRNLKGVSQQSANSTKNFSKMAQGIGGKLVPAYATLAANIFAVTAAFSAFRKSAQIEELEANLVRVGNVGGRNLRQLSEEITALTGNAIDAEQALRTTAQATTQGFSSKQLQDLTRVAKGAAISLGRELPDALDRLVRGTAKLEPEILDELGIIVRLDDAAEQYATSIGKTASQLTQFEKQQAFANAVTEQGLKKFGDIAKVAKANPYDQLAATFSNLTKTLFEGLNTALIPFVEFLSEKPTALIGVVSIFASGIINQLTPALSEMASEGKEKFEALSKAADKAAKAVETKYQAALKNLPETDISPAGFKKLEASIRSGTASVNDLQKGLKSLQTSERLRVKNINNLKLETEGLRGVEKTAHLAKIAEKEAELALIQAQIAATQELKSIQASGTASSISGGRGSASRTADNARSRSNMAGIEAGALGAMAGAGLVEQFKLAASASKNLTKEVGTASGVLGKVGAAGRVAAGGVRLFGTALLNAIPIVGQIIFFATLAYEALTAIFGDPFETTASEEAAEKIKKSMEDMTKAAFDVRQAMNDADTASKKFFIGLKASSGFSEQASQGLLSLAQAARDEPTRELNELRDKASEGISGFWNKIAIAASGERRRAIKALSGGPDGDIFLQPDFEKKIQAKIIELRQADVESQEKVVKAAEVDRAPLLEALNAQINALKNAEVVPESQIKILEDFRAQVQALEKDGKITADQVEAVEQAFTKAGEPATRFIAAIDNIGNATAELDKNFQDFIKKSDTPFSNLRRSAESLQNEFITIANEIDKIDNIDSIKLEELLSGAGGEGVTKLIERIAPALKEAENPAEVLKNAISSYVDNLTELEKQFRDLQTNIKASKEEQAELGKFAKQSVVFTKALNAEKVKELGYRISLIGEEIKSLETRKEEEGVQDRITELEKEQGQLLTQQANIKNDQLSISEALVAEEQRRAQVENKITQGLQEQFRIQQQIDEIQDRRRLRESRRQFAFDFIDQGRQELEDRKRREQERLAQAAKVDQSGRAVQDDKGLFVLSETQQKIDASKMAVIRAEYALLTARIMAEEEIARERGNKLLNDNDPTNNAEGQSFVDSANTLKGVLTDLSTAEEIAIENVQSATQARIAGVQETVDAIQESIENLEPMQQVLDGIESSLTTGMTNAFADIITGTKSVKDAFLQMGKMVLQTIAQIIAQLIVMKILQAATGFFGGFGGGGAPATTPAPTRGGFFRYGGVAEPPAYAAMGGVFSGKQSGYPAVLHGTEAVVPLPDNKSIPVDLKGAAGQQNNVTVNVTVDGNGNASRDKQSSSQQGANLGDAIAIAVQKELQNQKRAGGILSPYGVA